MPGRAARGAGGLHADAAGGALHVDGWLALSYYLVLLVVPLAGLATGPGSDGSLRFGVLADVEVHQVQLMLDRRRTVRWDAGRGQDRPDRRADALALVTLPVFPGLPHVEVPQTTFDPGHNLHHQTVRDLVPDPVLLTCQYIASSPGTS